jgi:hypothetical protein
MIFHQVNAFLLQAGQALLFINKTITRMRATQNFIAKFRAQFYALRILTDILKCGILIILLIFYCFLAKSTLI